MNTPDLNPAPSPTTASPPPLTPGTLYLVATPIGNLEDITLRAIRVLRDCTLVAAEDTRRTGNLFARYGVTTPRVSCHEHNEFRRIPEVLERLAHAKVADGQA